MAFGKVVLVSDRKGARPTAALHRQEGTACPQHYVLTWAHLKYLLFCDSETWSGWEGGALAA